MMELQLGKWLLLTTLLVIDSEGASESNPWITPIPNLDAAMEGFNPLLSNHLERPDPGFRNQIFEPMRVLPDGRVTVNSFIDKVRKDLHCDTELSSTILRNYNEYEKEKTSCYKFALNANISAKAGLGNFSFSASAGYGRQSTDEERAVQKLFQESNGEIVKNKAECITHSVGISLFEKPVFTAAFTTALRELHVASKTPDSESSRQMFVKFVQSYGTHFMRTTYLGSKLIFLKRFAIKTDNSSLQSSRAQCVTNSAYASLGINKTVDNFSASFEMASKNCEHEDESKSYFQNNLFSSQKVISIGSYPQDNFQKWPHHVKESPEPIYYELEKISTFFTSKWFSTLSTDDADPQAEKLNGTAMYDFFEHSSILLCQLILGKECDSNRKGCGHNSLCFKDQSCRNDPTTELGFKCNDVKKYGPVLMMGGHNGMSGMEGYLSDGDAIDTWALPFLPDAVWGNTLAAVGSKVYSCGGHNYTEGSISKCYAIDRSSGDLVWEATNSLPEPMFGHSSVTIKDHIWTVYNRKLHDLDTNSNQFHTFHLPMMATEGHCAVSNGSHVFIIGAGPNKNEIWVNKEIINPAKWHKVGNLPSGRQYHGCVWFEESIFITGGSLAQKDALEFDSVNHTLRPAGSLVQGRGYHGMAVLESRPAVVGGYDGTGSISSIETYDTRTKRWMTSLQSLIEVRSNFGLVQLHN